MIKDIKDLALNSFYLYLIQGLNYLLPLLSLPFLLNVLSKESFGIYIYALSFSQFAILLIDFGFNISVTKKITLLQNESDEINRVYWSITFVKFLFFLISSVICAIVVFLFPYLEIYRTGIFIAFISLIGSVFFPIWWFQGLNKMRTLSIINAFSKLLTYPFLFLFVKQATDHSLAIFIQSSSVLLAGLLSVVFINIKYKYYKKFSFSFFKLTILKEEIKEAWPIFLSNSAISLYTNSLTVILGFYTTAAYVGLFGAIERIIRVICFGVFGPVSQASFPVIARFAVIDFNKAKYVFRLVFYGLLFLMCFACVGFVLIEDFIIHKFFASYPNVKFLLRISILTIIPIALGGACGQLGLLALGNMEQKKVFSNIYVSVGICSIPVSLFSIYFFKVEGAIFSMMLVELIIFLLMYFYVKKYNFL
ncbi:oligosaccharide flippase family protein [Flavobacterium sp. 7A]|uniref:oligosaccharide flippase family protein n=1 Tax=Flavobacterium sp. 7A TaxID=2940571 RepID=UPI00222746D3|nr:oligosaccharide flippase family protein [Flavobacterium sp. 7A]MCW2119413.1 O-antigen/teichoic acid export membrane protein [Flavobacterium sp. 7A]